MTTNRRSFCLSALALATSPLTSLADSSEGELVVRPKEYTGALKNPLKGLAASNPKAAAGLPYASLARSYVKWNQIETNANDSVQRIRDFCNAEWAGLPRINTKVVPRVYLDWPPNGHYWPSDLPQGQYDTSQFAARAVALIGKLGDAWDNDPRVAFIETGLVGLWGEQHDPAPSDALQKILGDAFTASFKNKLMMNRYPGHFTAYNFGIYWDSFGHKEELPTHMPLLTSARMADRWKTAPMGGETAFDWGTPLGKDPTDALVRNADTIIELIRKLHWDHLGWLSNYDQTNAIAAANAARVQEALGYRFKLEEVRYPKTLMPGSSFRVAVTISNTGSSPLYYPWPLEVSLLDLSTRMPRWKARFANTTLQAVLPGAAQRFSCQFACPSELPRGQYLLALSILDPAGMQPAARFACAQYFQGGRHPVGWVGVKEHSRSEPLPSFDNPAADQLLMYSA